ncbi:MAG: lipocalin family protein [Bacteroidales bacterium]|nr:lipocalin family protein [Bacteroidales bacterium]MBR1959316.1 lipocalin family protein [Bacteroidales bacterium]
MNKVKMLIAAAFAVMSLISCTEKPEVTVEYLDVNANNISGKWELVEWNGAPLTEGTYVYLDIVRNDRTYTMYQNLDSFTNVPHKVTGSYYIEYDPELGAILRGNYDHDSGDWAHRYIVKDLTATEMYWIAKDDRTFIQKYVRVDSIPVE